MARRQVLVQLDDELVKELDELAERKNMSRSELLRKGGWAIIHAAWVEDADRRLREGYERFPPDEDLMESLARQAALNAPPW